MIIQFLGVIDAIFGLILIFESNLHLSNSVLLFCAIVLFIKASFSFFKDFASWIDAFAGLLFILSILISIPFFLEIIAGLLLIQKGVFSFL